MHQDRDAQAIDRVIADLEKAIEVACKPPAEDFGCDVAKVEKRPNAADHHAVGFGLCDRTIDHVEMTTSAPFQRLDPEVLVFDPNARTLRFVPVTAFPGSVIAIPIQPPMQTNERLQAVVQGMPSGASVEITPA